MKKLFYLRFESISLLQEQVTALNICSKCHTKTLIEKYKNENVTAYQCSSCLTAYLFKSSKDAGTPRP